MEGPKAAAGARQIKPITIIQIALGLGLLGFVAWRLAGVLQEGVFGPETWVRLLVAGLIIGSVYAVIAIGYTLVYGILLMINFAHGEVMMLGAFAGYFTLEALNVWEVRPSTSFMEAFGIPAVVLAFAVGMLVSMIVGVSLERIAYRPLRKAPRLVPLISAIGSSLFLQNAALLMFSSKRRVYANPVFLDRTQGFSFLVNEQNVLIPYTGVLTIVLSLLLLLGLYTLVQRTKLGRAMRAVAEDKKTAALMGIDVDRTISQTFAISGLLAGAAGVMWGLHNGIIFHYVGFIPGLKAFTAAVLGGIGNLPGAVVGGFLLGLVESIGPAALGFDFQLKDVIAFSILVFVLIFRPSGILGEVLSEEKV